MNKLKVLGALFAMNLLLSSSAFAQEEWEEGSSGEGGGSTEEGESPFSLSGYFRAQAGMFVPLASDGFKPQKNRAYEGTPDGLNPDKIYYGEPCDPVAVPHKPCYPLNHGKDPGSLSMARSVLLIEGEWRANDKTRIRAIVRGVRSFKLKVDEWAASIPHPSPIESHRRDVGEDWAQEVYNEADLREFYLDTQPFDWLSLRVGRQQISWGEIGQYRLLDVINPVNETWHPAFLETFEDTRIPLWMAKGTIDFGLEQSLEMIWAPLFLDRPEDTVSTSLGWVGAWGVPVSNTPTAYDALSRVSKYPGGLPKDMRGGARWKGNVGSSFSFSLAYFYTHQLSPPVLAFFDQHQRPEGGFDSKIYDRVVLEYPRQHIAGFSLEYAFESPIGMVLRIESAVEPNRSFSASSANPGKMDPDVPGRFWFPKTDKAAINYGVVIQRPTMIRFLNPTQNFLLVAQFLHTFIPGLTEVDKTTWKNIPGFNNNNIETHEMKVVLVANTNYLNGKITPTIIGIIGLPDSEDNWGGIITASVAYRMGEYWRLKMAVTDFFGSDAYKGIGLFRDRDEINLTLTCLF